MLLLLLLLLLLAGLKRLACTNDVDQEMRTSVKHACHFLCRQQ